MNAVTYHHYLFSSGKHFSIYVKIGFIAVHKRDRLLLLNPSFELKINISEGLLEDKIIRGVIYV